MPALIVSQKRNMNIKKNIVPPLIAVSVASLDEDKIMKAKGNTIRLEPAMNLGLERRANNTMLNFILSLVVTKGAASVRAAKTSRSAPLVRNNTHMGSDKIGLKLLEEQLVLIQNARNKCIIVII